MKVKDLIEKLQTVSPDADVTVPGAKTNEIATEMLVTDNDDDQATTICIF